MAIKGDLMYGIIVEPFNSPTFSGVKGLNIN